MYQHMHLHLHSHIKISLFLLKKKKQNKTKWCNKKHRMGGMIEASNEEWRLSIKDEDVVKKFVKGFLKSNDLLF